jgi:hypothetical protein
MSSPLADLQHELRDRLKGDSYFSDITVLAEREGEIQNKIDRALKAMTATGGKIGLAVVIGVAAAQVNNADAPGPMFDDASFEVLVFEHVLMNASASGTKKAAVDAAVRAAQVLHHYRPAPLGQTLYCDKAALTYEGLRDESTVVYKIRIRVPANHDVLDKVAIPSISSTGTATPQTVTLSCGTSGASIYYTTDGSYPRSGNTAAPLYSTPFVLSQAATLRVVAFKTGYVASDAAAVVFT